MRTYMVFNASRNPKGFIFFKKESNSLIYRDKKRLPCQMN